MATLAEHAPLAFRAVVLFRGKDDPANSDVERARERVAKTALAGYQVPHVVYCASFRTDGEESSYIVFYDYRAQAMRFHEHRGDPTSALASFLRIFTGFLAVQGLISPSLHLDLLPVLPTKVLDELAVSDAAAPFELLQESLSKMDGVDAMARYDERLREWLRQDPPYSVLCRFVTGSDARGLPTAGVSLQIQWEDASKPMAAAFFYLTTPDVFTCADARDEEAWTVEGETVEAHVQRILTELGRRHTFNRPLRAMRSAEASDVAGSLGKDLP